MAKIKFYREEEAALPTNNVAHTGKVYFTESRRIFVYDNSGNKQQMTDVIFMASEAAIIAIGAPIPLKIYVAIAEGTMWRWETSGSTWEELGGSAGGGGTSINWLGPWSAGAYTLNDAVSYNGQSYIGNTVSIVAGDVPGVSSRWDLLAQKGADGADGADGTNGISINWQGAWLAGSYALNDAVSYNGQSYIANTSAVVAADVPGVSSRWDLLVAKGTDGMSLNWQGAWTATNYALNDAVSYNGSSYIANAAANSGDVPGVSARWDLLAAKGAAGAGTGDMLAANNLSEVDAAVAIDNLGVYSSSNVDTLLAAKASKTGAETLTNKRITMRVQTVASAATVTPNADADDCVKITAQAVALTLANPSGTPTSMQPLTIEIKDNGTARAITYGTQYRAIGLTLPTTTVAGKITAFGMYWDVTDSKWNVVGVGTEA